MSCGAPRGQHEARKRTKDGERPRAHSTVQLAAIGIEAEFTVLLDGKAVTPEELWGSPRHFIRGPLMHRTGRSYQVPTGGAVYFDTGVVEVATPMIELGPGCAARAGRSLWESIRFLRAELDAWEQATGQRVDLAGFSTHYNVSFDIPRATAEPRTVERLAWLLTHVIPFPVMLLAANRKSTGIGVRPRDSRVEITADFTPDASLMIAATATIVGIVREAMTWPSFDLRELNAHRIPRLDHFVPRQASSRKGWVARYDAFESNPFAADIDVRRWKLLGGGHRSLRELGAEVVRLFHSSIERYADSRSMALIDGIMDGTVPSLLELVERPASYESVGRLCTWPNLFPLRALTRSGYEQVFINAVSRTPLRLGGRRYVPTGMKGWSHVVFRRDGDGSRHAFSLDFLLRHLHRWPTDARSAARVLPRPR